MKLQIGDAIKRKKDGHPMTVVPDNEAVLYVDNDKIGITDATAYLDFGAVVKAD